MENEKTKLQKIVEQKTEQIKSAVLEAIAAGAEIKTGFAGVTIDGVFFVGNSTVDPKAMTLCMQIRSDELEEVLKPTSVLDEEAEQLRERLKEIEEIKERRAKK
jgi:predicted ATP-grasp superfamily ATP-dependent carboligase